MDHLSPLISIEQYAFTKTFSLYILSYYLHPCFLRSPLRFFNLPKLIRSTHRIGASVGLRRTWPNHRRWFSLIFSSIEATPILIRISSFLTLSLRVLPHIQRSMRISATQDSELVLQKLHVTSWKTRNPLMPGVHNCSSQFTKNNKSKLPTIKG